MGNWNWLWVALIIVIILILVAWLLRQKFQKTIKDLDEEKKTLFDSAVDQLFAEAEQINKTGLYAEKYDRLNEEYGRIQNDIFTSIENYIFKADKANEKFNFIVANQNIQEAEELIEKGQMHFEKVHADMKRFVNAEASNLEYEEKFKKNYRESYQKLQSSNVDLRGARENLAQRFETLDQLVGDFHHLNEAGDYYAAENSLDAATAELAQINSDMEKIPDYFERLDKKYADAIDQLEEGYQIFQDHQIEFEEDDFQEKIKAFRSLNDQAIEDVEQLNLERAEGKMKELEVSLQAAKDNMMVEYDAYQNVQDYMNRIQKIIEYLKDKNELMKEEADRFSQSYRISDELLSFPSKNEGRILDLENAYEGYAVAFQSHRTVYSLALETVEDFFKKSKDLSKEQDQYIDMLHSLKKDEATYRKNADYYANKMRQIKRGLDRLNLPGISKEYRDLYAYTTEKIQALAVELNRHRLDVPALSSIDQEVRDLIDELDYKYQQILHDTTLVEQMIVYLKENYAEEAEVIKAVLLASQQYNEAYNYHQAYLTLARVLENLEPQRLRQLEDDFTRR